MNAMIVNKRLIKTIKILKDHPASQFSLLPKRVNFARGQFIKYKTTTTNGGDFKLIPYIP